MGGEKERIQTQFGGRKELGRGLVAKIKKDLGLD